MPQPKKKMGRPQIQIDKKEFEKLCALQCTQLEMCSWFDVDENTINAWCKREYGKTFSEVFAAKRGKGKVALRRIQYQLAEKNPSMAIFLGKQYLGQSDNPQAEEAQAKTIDALIEAVKNID